MAAFYDHVDCPHKPIPALLGISFRAGVEGACDQVIKERLYASGAPSISEALIWIARLGGYLARNGDGSPGTLVLWRGWKRLVDLTEGWCLANQ